jgi:hypothetical protein
MNEFQLPIMNALASSDKDTLRTLFASVIKEINRLREEIRLLQQQGNSR